MTPDSHKFNQIRRRTERWKEEEFGKCLMELKCCKQVVSPASLPTFLLFPPTPHLQYSLTTVQKKLNHILFTHTTETFQKTSKLHSNLEALWVTQKLWNKELFLYYFWPGLISVRAPGTPIQIRSYTNRSCCTEHLPLMGQNSPS